MQIIFIFCKGLFIVCACVSACVCIHARACVQGICVELRGQNAAVGSHFSDYEACRLSCLTAIKYSDFYETMCVLSLTTVYKEGNFLLGLINLFIFGIPLQCMSNKI